MCLCDTIRGTAGDAVQQRIGWSPQSLAMETNEVPGESWTGLTPTIQSIHSI